MPDRPSGRDQYVGEEVISVLGMVNTLLRHSRLLVAIPLAVVVVVVALTLLRGASYTAESRFTPQQRKPISTQFAGLAAQFGVDVGGASSEESIHFYSELIQSWELLDEVAQSDYRFVTEDGDTLTGSFIELMAIDEGSAEDRRLEAVAELRDRLSTSTNVEAGLVTLSVEAPWAGLAVQVNERILELVNRFNLDKRQSQAKAERAFIESRLAENGLELALAEDSLRTFLQENRSIATSPRLSFEQMRLQRQVDLHQKVYAALAESYEQARIQEVRNTPLITVIAGPGGPVEKSGGVVRNAAVGLLVGLLLAVLIAFVREYFARQRAANPAEYREFQALRRQALRRPGLPGAEEQVGAPRGP